MRDDWDADIVVEAGPSGLFVAVLVLKPPSEIGAAVRWVIPGEYESAMRAECAALDAFTAIVLQDRSQ